MEQPTVELYLPHHSHRVVGLFLFWIKIHSQSIIRNFCSNQNTVQRKFINTLQVSC